MFERPFLHVTLIAYLYLNIFPVFLSNHGTKVFGTPRIEWKREKNVHLIDGAHWFSSFLFTKSVLSIWMPMLMIDIGCLLWRNESILHKVTQHVGQTIELMHLWTSSNIFRHSYTLKSKKKMFHSFNKQIAGVYRQHGMKIKNNLILIFE